MNDSTSSPNWNRPTKIIVAIASSLLILVVLYRFRSLMTSVVIGAILAYLTFPIIEFLNRRSRIERSTITVITYIVFTLIFIGLFVALGLTLFGQVTNLIVAAPMFIQTTFEQIEAFYLSLPESIMILGFEIALPESNFSLENFNSLASQLVDYVQPLLGSIGSSLGSAVLGTVGTIGNLVVILFVSIYIAIDAPRLQDWIGNVAEFPGYRYDAERLWRDFGRIWQAYLRGQAILGLVIGVTVFVCMLILGVENALVLGIISGIMEFIPFIGPFIGAAAAVIVSFFQDSGANTFGLSPLYFALVVLAVMSLIQQIENNFLVPRIVGDALDLNPLIVFVGALMGASLAGILGTILAAPVLATIKLIGTYAWRKMFDLDPFPKAEIVAEDEPTWVENLWEQWQLRRAGDRPTPTLTVSDPSPENTVSAAQIEPPPAPPPTRPPTDPPEQQEADPNKVE